MILAIGPTLDPVSVSDAQIENVRTTLAKAQMHVPAFQFTLNHIDPNAQGRAEKNASFVKAIELAGKLGVPYIGTASGKDPAKAFHAQIDEIVRVYNEKYFPACERNRVRILWEPWPEGPNLATSPVGFRGTIQGIWKLAVCGAAVRSIASGPPVYGPHPNCTRLRRQNL